MAIKQYSEPEFDLKPGDIVVAPARADRRKKTGQTTIPKRHPCQKRSDEIEDDSKDYIELINKLQPQVECCLIGYNPDL